jgi:hypothetical protein
MVSHQIGKHAGIMLRAALRYGYKGYLRASNHQSTLQCFEGLDEILYHHRPLPKDIDAIITELGPEFDRVFESILNRAILGTYGNDARYAFSSENRLYTEREAFLKDFGLPPGRRNVFVMLHAFNDHPHSHFKGMIFRDYYDWFVKTLGFARTSNRVNWIFKQHPSIKFYPMRDVSFERLFRDVPNNVVYIGEENQIDTRSLIACADVVITCAGSAGFELPAMAGIPSIVAGDTFYAGLGFAIEPKTNTEYFRVLETARNIERLTREKQRRAQAAYMFIYEFSRVRMSACPELSYEEEKDSDQGTWFWKKVGQQYEAHREAIVTEICDYVEAVTKPGFKRLVGLQRHRPIPHIEQSATTFPG